MVSTYCYCNRVYLKQTISHRTNKAVSLHAIPKVHTRFFAFGIFTSPELRKESRRLENEVEMKLVSFSKLGSSQSRENSIPNVGNPAHVFDTMSLEIEGLLGKLRNVNEALNECVSGMAAVSGGSSSVSHTLQRHNDILQDYTQEYNRTKANVLAQRQREELLGNARKDSSQSGSALTRRTELYLKEHEHIRGTEKVADEAISIAIATKENLSYQRNMFSGITTRVAGVTNRFPLINSLVQKINLRRRRDSLILGGVIAICIIILFLFVLR